MRLRGDKLIFLVLLSVVTHSPLYADSGISISVFEGAIPASEKVNMIKLPAPAAVDFDVPAMKGSLLDGQRVEETPRTISEQGKSADQHGNKNADVGSDNKALHKPALPSKAQLKKPEKAARPDTPERPPRPDRPTLPEKPPRPERPDHPERPGK